MGFNKRFNMLCYMLSRDLQVVEYNGRGTKLEFSPQKRMRF